MIEFAEIATMAFIVSGITYRGVKYWRSGHRIRLKKEIPVSLVIRDTTIPERFPHATVIVLEQHGYLIHKLPDAHLVRHKGQCKLRCSSPAGKMNFCVLFTSSVPNLSGIHTRDDIDHLFVGERDYCIAETGLREISHRSLLELTPVRGGSVGENGYEAASATLDTLLLAELITDAMAKEHAIDLQHCNEPWSTGRVHYSEGESDNWLSLRRENGRLILQLRTNFGNVPREATAEICGETSTHILSVKQQAMGLYSTLTVSRQLYVSEGRKNEVVPITVIPDNEEVHWRIKGANAADGCCWYALYPPLGMLQKGTQTLQIHLGAKPANVRSRSLTLTLETGTYPLSQSTEITFMQGICFDYYIEYPKGDLCARHSHVIETPMGYTEGDGWKTYIVCVDSNQSWRIIRNEQVDWVETGEPELTQRSYVGKFTVRVRSNAGNRVKNGIPAARHTVLSLVNDTGIVKDILIYQGGYVRIRGQYWLDRNLDANGQPAPVAIPLGLEEGSKLNHGGYFQFGSKDNRWLETFVPCKGDWYEGTIENPSRLDAIDPSPAGWRLPSRLEIESLINRPAAPMELQREEDRTNICLLSDDGVPVYLPLCGHRSHINGCLITIAHGHRYWTGSSQSPVYGYSLCVEPSRRMCMMHEMKKYGFPVRCVLDEKEDN